MSDPGARPGARIEAVIAALLVVVAVLGLTVLPLTTAPFVRTLVELVGSDELTGLSARDTREAAESVRRFVIDPQAPPLAAEIDGRVAFDEPAVSHLVDVREVIVPARTVAIALVVLCGAWVLVRMRTARGRLLVASALRASAWIVAGAVVLAVLVGVTSFDALFAWFHSLFFEAGTWMFPADALLIQVFPLPFWVAAAASWGALMLAVAGLLLVASARLRFTPGMYGV